MRVFVAGATGVLGRPVVRRLVAAGHEVVGLTRRKERAEALRALGAQAVTADALSGDDLVRAVEEARPTHVVHLLTALPPEGPLRARDLRQTNALRVEGTRHLLVGAARAGAARVVAESFVGVYGGGRDDLIDEHEPLGPPAGPFAEAIGAMRALEDMLARARPQLTTVALRFGLLYGPDVPATLALARRILSGRLVVPRGATGVGSFVHSEDAAAAVVAALEHPAPGPVYNVCDDEPFPIARYLDLASVALGARPPRRVPPFLVRLVAPLLAEGAFTRLAMSNARAKADLGWRPAFPTLRDGVLDVAQALGVGI